MCIKKLSTERECHHDADEGNKCKNIHIRVYRNIKFHRVGSPIESSAKNASSLDWTQLARLSASQTHRVYLWIRMEKQKTFNYTLHAHKIINSKKNIYISEQRGWWWFINLVSDLEEFFHLRSTPTFSPSRASVFGHYTENLPPRLMEFKKPSHTMTQFIYLFPKMGRRGKTILEHKTQINCNLMPPHAMPWQHRLSGPALAAKHHN